ncbi:MAG: hypothetical protein P1U77_28315 [Rubripirellula sp.]|nr:hypothetical protein [Rubripirellula sp.]
MEIREAMRQISDIRRQMARTEIFRGYRSATVGVSALLGILAALFQSKIVPSPTTDLERYLLLWVGVAAVSVMMTGVELCWGWFRSGPGLSRELTRLAISQFVPCLVVGGLLTLSIYRAAPQVAWMLPGLWSFIFALGVFASFRLLPPQAYWIGSYYVFCGVLCLLLGQGQQAFAPWQMGVTFGGGQGMSAMILYWTLERNDAS